MNAKLVLLLLITIIFGCSKGSSPGTGATKVTAETAQIIMAGRASAGNIKNAAVKAYCKNFGEARGEQISNTTITASDGTYTLLFATAPTCPLEIVVADAGDGLAEYIEEATGNPVSLGIKELRTLVPEIPAGTTQLTVAVTLLTDLAATFFESKENNRLAMSVTEMKDLIKASNAFVAAAAGISDLVSTIPADSTIRTGAESPDQKKYAAFLAGISQISEDEGKSSFDVLNDFANDLVGDGALDDTSWGTVDVAYNNFVASPDNVTHLGEDGDDTSFLPIPAPVLPDGFSFSDIKIAQLTVTGPATSQMPAGRRASTCVELTVTADVVPTLDTAFAIADSDDNGYFYSANNCSGGSLSRFTFPAKVSSMKIYYRRYFNYGDFSLTTESEDIATHIPHIMIHLPSIMNTFEVTWWNSLNTHKGGCNLLTLKSVDSTGFWTTPNLFEDSTITLPAGNFFADGDCSLPTNTLSIGAGTYTANVFFKSSNAAIPMNVPLVVSGHQVPFSIEILWPLPVPAEKIWNNPINMADNISPDLNQVETMSSERIKMVMSANGDAMIAWRQLEEENGNARLFVSHLKNGTWTHPSSIDDYISVDPTGDVFFFHLAMDDNGNALIAWSEYNGELVRMYKREYNKENNNWIKPSDVDDAISPPGESVDAWAVQAAMKGNGNALIVWEQELEGAYSQIFKSEKRNGVWSHPVNLADNISPDGQTAIYPKVAMDDNGNSIICWLQVDAEGIETQIFKSEFRNGAWKHPSDLDDNISLDASSAADISLGMDNNGNAIIVWGQYNGEFYQLYKSEYRNGAWIHPAILSDHFTRDGADTYYFDLAMGKSGDVVIAYVQYHFQDNEEEEIQEEIEEAEYLYKSHFRNGAWTHAQSTADAIPMSIWPFEYPRVAVDNNGSALIVWAGSGGTDSSAIYKSEFRNGVWDHPESAEDNVSSTVGYSLWPQVVMSADGTALIGWVAQDDFGVQAFKSEYK